MAAVPAARQIDDVGLCTSNRLRVQMGRRDTVLEIGESQAGAGCGASGGGGSFGNCSRAAKEARGAEEAGLSLLEQFSYKK